MKLLGCYAYRKGDVFEDLAKHLIDVAECVKRRWELKAVSTKLASILKCDKQAIGDLIVLGALLHDIGKASEIYQADCSKNCTSFHQHYLVSALLVCTVFENIGITVTTTSNQKLSELHRCSNGFDSSTVRVLTVLPILFHHYHQIKGFKSYRIDDKYDLKISRECNECLEEISGYILQTMPSIDRRIAENLRNLQSIVSQNSDAFMRCRIFISNIHDFIEKEEFHGFNLGKAVVEAVAGLINLCDGYVAHLARRR